MEEYCICKHLKNRHGGWEGEPTGCTVYLVQAEYFDDTDCQCCKFKLDNLRYVEDLAKKRNLMN